MDIKRFNYLDWESIYSFIKHFAGAKKECQPTKRKMAAIFRRLDINSDQKISFNEFAETIKPVDVYFTDIDDQNTRRNKELVSSRDMSKLKKNLSTERQQKRSLERTRPLRTFKGILNSKD